MEDSDVIEHHVEEEMEKKEPRSRAAVAASSPTTSLFPESVAPSVRGTLSGTASSHRLLAYSDALISIIATVMVLSR